MNNLLYYLNDEDEPVPTDDPVAWANHPRHHIHVGDEMVGPWRVSTVFMGIDTGFEPGHLVLWETMIFGPEPWSHWQRRYASHAEALNGHAGAVAMLEKTRGRDGRAENRADRGRARSQRVTPPVDGERSDQEVGNNDAA